MAKPRLWVPPKLYRYRPGPDGQVAIFPCIPKELPHLLKHGVSLRTTRAQIQLLPYPPVPGNIRETLAKHRFTAGLLIDLGKLHHQNVALFSDSDGMLVVEGDQQDNHIDEGCILGSFNMKFSPNADEDDEPTKAKLSRELKGLRTEMKVLKNPLFIRTDEEYDSCLARDGLVVVFVVCGKQRKGVTKSPARAEFKKLANGGIQDTGVVTFAECMGMTNLSKHGSLFKFKNKTSPRVFAFDGKECFSLIYTGPPKDRSLTIIHDLKLLEGIVQVLMRDVDRTIFSYIPRLTLRPTELEANEAEPEDNYAECPFGQLFPGIQILTSAQEAKLLAEMDQEMLNDPECITNTRVPSPNGKKSKRLS